MHAIDDNLNKIIGGTDPASHHRSQYKIGAQTREPRLSFLLFGPRSKTAASGALKMRSKRYELDRHADTEVSCGRAGSKSRGGNRTDRFACVIVDRNEGMRPFHRLLSNNVRHPRFARAGLGLSTQQAHDANSLIKACGPSQR